VICDFVAECGMQPIGPATGLDHGWSMPASRRSTVAILDINLDGRCRSDLPRPAAARHTFCF